MDKKGVFVGFFADMIGWAFLFIGIIFWIFIFTIIKESITSEISEIPYAGDDVVMLSYLRTPTGKGIVLDAIYDAYKYNDNTAVHSALDRSLNAVYGRVKTVCWKLGYYVGEDRRLLVEESCGETKELFDKDLVVPLPYNPQKKNIKLKLTVPGYK